MYTKLLKICSFTLIFFFIFQITSCKKKTCPAYSNGTGFEQIEKDMKSSGKRKILFFRF